MTRKILKKRKEKNTKKEDRMCKKNQLQKQEKNLFTFFNLKISNNVSYKVSWKLAKKNKKMLKKSIKREQKVQKNLIS